MSYQQYRPNPFNVLPLVVKNLIIINALFLLATVTFASKIDLNDILGLHHPFSDKLRPFQFVTYMFMHADIHHLISNMFTLWIFGSLIENYWGPKRFLIYYIITGIGAACIHYLIVCYQMQPTINAVDAYLASPSLESFHLFINSEHLRFSSVEMLHTFDQTTTYFNQAITSHSYTDALRISVDYMHTFRMDYLNAPTIIGASGSVFGVLLAAGMLFPNHIPFYLIPIKTKWIVLIYGLTELFTGIANKPNDNVAHFAHLGGMLFGFILIKFWQKRSSNFY